MLFYLLFAGTLILVFFSHPFLKYPYDMFTHLQKIDAQSIADSIPQKRVFWHYLWGQFFNLIHIDRTDIFLRARIVHYTQTILSFLLVFFASRIFLKTLFTRISSITLHYMAYWSTIIWFIAFSNASQYHHQVWILWYSINYQITLPMTYLATALSISLLFQKETWRAKALKAAGVLFLLYLVLRMHAMEFLYYLMYMGVLFLLFIDKISVWFKRYLYISLPVLLALFFLMQQLVAYINAHSYRKSPLFKYLSLEKLPQLWEKIQAEGALLIGYYNKVDFVLNELIYLSVAAAALLMGIVLYRYYKKQTDDVRIRLVLFLFITSLFIFIPVFQTSAGIASVLTYKWISYRFYYSSLLFLALPAFAFYLFSLVKLRKIWALNAAIVTILISLFLYSRYDITHRQNFYRNIASLKNAFDAQKMAFNLSDTHIRIIGEKLAYYEKQNRTGKPNYYYARDDIAFVIKFIYQKPVFYKRKGTLNYVKSYHKHHKRKYHPVLFETPKELPPYGRFQ